MTSIRLIAAGFAVLAASAPAGAQIPRPHLDWRTVETPHFRFHYPAQAERWTLDVASRIESVSEAVGALVGSRPRQRVTVVVEDPLAQSNGSAWPLLDRPLIYLWPTPASARSSIGHSRSWEEELAVHEYAHIAHLARPSRNPRERLIWRLSPLPGGPVATRAPRWAVEGYATYIEGRLTGSGRPYGAARAAVLREWALSGQLPRYAEVSGAGGYRAGEMAYLAGSAFIEWLVARSGEQSLPALWRRLSARQKRSFDAAFAGVYAATPAALYGRFTAELTGHALAAERRIGVDSAGLGELVLTPRGDGFDDPAVSPDGALLAVRVRLPDRAGPVLVARTEGDTLTTRARRARERLRARDPEDVPAVEYLPPPKRVVGRLEPSHGAGYEEPRFFADARRVLVTRSTPLADGSARPDLYEWTFATGRVRRITRGANVRGADPAPDGRTAVATRCRFGACELVIVDLATGGVRSLGAPVIGRAFDRPRFSPDGRSVAVAVQEGGRWRPVLYTMGAVDGGGWRDVPTIDAASRYEPAFSANGRELLVTSERGGIANVESIDLATGAARAVTAVSGAAAAPAPGAGDSVVYYLNLRAGGLEVRRIGARRSRQPAPLVSDSGLAPALPPRPAAVVDTFARGPVERPHAYGLGPRSWRWLPAVLGGRDGTVYGVAVVNADPVSRLTLLAQGGLGPAETWRGGGLGVAYRGWRPTLAAELFTLRQEARSTAASAQGALASGRLAGGTASVTLLDDFGWRRSRYRAGASTGSLTGNAGAPEGSRSLAFAEYDGSYEQTVRGLRLGAAGGVHGSAGATGGDRWRRAVADLRVSAAAAGVSVSAAGAIGTVDRDAPGFERFVGGGITAPFIDVSVLSQRRAIPALPVGFAAGSRFASYRFATALAGLEPYYLAITFADDLRGGWTRVLGAEQRVVVPPLGLLGLPPFELTGGIGYPLTGPSRYDTQLYGGVRLRP